MTIDGCLKRGQDRSSDQGWICRWPLGQRLLITQGRLDFTVSPLDKQKFVMDATRMSAVKPTKCSWLKPPFSAIVHRYM